MKHDHRGLEYRPGDRPLWRPRPMHSTRCVHRKPVRIRLSEEETKAIAKNAAELALEERMQRRTPHRITPNRHAAHRHRSIRRGSPIHKCLEPPPGPEEIGDKTKLRPLPCATPDRRPRLALTPEKTNTRAEQQAHKRAPITHRAQSRNPAFSASWPD